jgi:hypothetical protein
MGLEFAIVVAIAFWGCVLAVACWDAPRKRTGSKRLTSPGKQA